MKSIFEFENLFTSNQTTQGIGDDFSTMFSSFYLKFFTGFLFFGVIFFSTILSLFLIQFEKFGNDPMKRSVTNLITSQIYYIEILSNIFFTPFLTWRVIIGPIQPNLTGTILFLSHCHTIKVPILVPSIYIPPKSLFFNSPPLNYQIRVAFDN